MSRNNGFKKLFFYVLVIMVVLSGCSNKGSGGTTETRTGSIAGYVLNDEIATYKTGEAKIVITRDNSKALMGIEGARVSIDGNVGTTNYDGYFEITGIPVGTYDVHIAHDNYLSINIENVTVIENGITPITGANFPRLYRLIIGIDDYPGDDSDLTGCVNDAEGYFDVLVANTQLDSSYYGTAEGDLIIDSNATKDNIENAIIDLGEVMQPDDHLVITFSGHGGYIVDEYGNPDPNGTDEYTGGTPCDEFIVAYDGISKEGYLNEEGIITDDELEDWVSTNILSSNILFIFDSCHSGGMYRSVNPEPLIKPKDLYGHGYAVITASRDDEFSYEVSGIDNGLFTHFFLEGIRTRDADENNDGDITALEAFNYAAEEIESFQEINEIYPKQHPQMFLEDYHPIIYRY